LGHLGLKVYWSLPGRSPIAGKWRGLGNGFEMAVKNSEMVFPLPGGKKKDGVEVDPIFFSTVRRRDSKRR
jgi:hypothetical protein